MMVLQAGVVEVVAQNVETDKGCTKGVGGFLVQVHDVARVQPIRVDLKVGDLGFW